jgi:hypothetical protein
LTQRFGFHLRDTINDHQRNREENLQEDDAKPGQGSDACQHERCAGCPDEEGYLKSREIWGTALLTVAALSVSVEDAINKAYWAAAREDLLLYAGIPGDSIASWFLIVALLSGAVGLFLLLPELIGRIASKALRRTVGWTTVAAAAAAVPYVGLISVFALLGAVGIADTVKVTAADGRSVLITQDGFDGDRVDIYTEHDELHYKRIRSAPEISGWPRVKDQDCQLDTAGGELRLTCGAITSVV